VIVKTSDLLTFVALGLIMAYGYAQPSRAPTSIEDLLQESAMAPARHADQQVARLDPSPEPRADANREIRPDRRAFAVHIVKPARLAMERILQPRPSGQGILERGFVDPAIFAPRPVVAPPPQTAPLPIMAPLAVPTPRLVHRRDYPDLFPSRRFVSARTELVALNSAPFPYDGAAPGGEFLNASIDGRPAHRTGSGRIYSVDETYGDSRSLLHIPAGFDATAPGVLVLFFHGFGATLTRDVWQRQRLPDQVSASGVNAVLVAPQFAVDARDSSIGRFWRPGALRKYLDDVAVQLARLYGDPSAASRFARLPVVIVGYSGGYVPAAFALTHGGIRDRVRGIVLLDGLYSKLSTFHNFIKSQRSAFFVSAFGHSTRSGNAELQSMLSEGSLRWRTELPPVLSAGEVVLVSAPGRHRDYVTDAWVHNPIADVLRRLPWVSRTGQGGRVASR